MSTNAANMPGRGIQDSLVDEALWVKFPETALRLFNFSLD